MAEVDPDRILVAPIAAFVRTIAESVADAQRALDRRSLELTAQIQTEPAYSALRDVGYVPTWYTIPEVQAEIKLTFYFEATRSAEQQRLLVLPWNAKTQANSTIREEGTSQLKIRIVPVPPPVGATPVGEPGSQ